MFPGGDTREDTADAVLGALTSPDGKVRAVIVRRADGTYTYRAQWFVETSTWVGWSPLGPPAGVYDSAETAESEARGRFGELTAYEDWRLSPLAPFPEAPDRSRGFTEVCLPPPRPAPSPPRPRRPSARPRPRQGPG